MPVRLLGYVPDGELASLLSHLVALLFPSRYEGFGIPALEAMAAGAPVVCSRAGALPEVVGDAGVLLAQTIPEKVLSAALELARSDGLRKQLIEAGRARASMFTWEQCASRLLAGLTSA